MKRTTRSCGWARLAASVLALVLLPAGCARQENSKTMEDSTPSETTGAAVPVNGGKSLLWSGTSLEGAWSGFIPSREPENFAGNRDDAAALAKAEELLLGTNLRIYAIAAKVGFGKAEYFINKFVQMHNMTPNQYRIRNRRAESGPGQGE